MYLIVGSESVDPVSFVEMTLCPIRYDLERKKSKVVWGYFFDELTKGKFGGSCCCRLLYFLSTSNKTIVLSFPYISFGISRV